MQILGERQGQIALVVVDSALPQSKRLLQATRNHCPDARVIALHGPRRIGQVSALVINTAVD